MSRRLLLILSSPVACWSRCSLLTVTLLLITLALVTFRYYNLLLSDAASDLPSSSHYAVVIDAGSSGSRVYLYEWPPHSGSPQQLLRIRPVLDGRGQPLVSKVSPGISSFASRPWDAARNVAPLLEFAAGHVPAPKHRETPLYILATAGMRLLDQSQQDALLTNLRVELPRKFGFLFPSDHAEVISGRQEGLYQWIAVNFVLGRFQDVDDPTQNPSANTSLVAVDVQEGDGAAPEAGMPGLVYRRPTVGAMDMGGASLQVAFEVTSRHQRDAKIMEINLGCQDHDAGHTYRVYVDTFLGLGANEAIRRYHDGLKSSDGTVIDPCLPRGLKEDLAGTGKPAHLLGSGDWDICLSRLETLLAPESANSSDPPPLLAPLPLRHTNFYGFSEFWYSLEDVLHIGGTYSFPSLRKASRRFCSAVDWITRAREHREGRYPMADGHRMRFQCFKSAWLAAVVHRGFGIPQDFTRLIASPNSLETGAGSAVVHWTLGALLYRTRFFPLRAVEQSTLRLGGQQRSVRHMTLLPSNYIVLGCLAAVVAAILLYIHRLRRMHQTRDLPLLVA